MNQCVIGQSQTLADEVGRTEVCWEDVRNALMKT